MEHFLRVCSCGLYSQEVLSFFIPLPNLLISSLVLHWVSFMNNQVHHDVIEVCPDIIGIDHVWESSILLPGYLQLSLEVCLCSVCIETYCSLSPHLNIAVSAALPLCTLLNIDGSPLLTRLLSNAAEKAVEYNPSIWTPVPQIGNQDATSKS